MLNTYLYYYVYIDYCNLGKNLVDVAQLYAGFVVVRDRLSASDMLHVRKVIEHIYEKLLGQGSDAGSQAAGSTTTPASGGGGGAMGGGSSAGNSQYERSDAEREEDISQIAEESVQLWCNDQVRALLPYGSFYRSSFAFNLVIYSVRSKWCAFTDSVDVIDSVVSL